MVIEGDVAGHRPGAEDPDFAHSLGADAAGGEVGDAAVGEAQARIGDVLRFAEHRNSDGVYVRDGRVHEGQHDVEIVNHQIEHHADVRAACRVGREAVRFDKARFGCDRLQVGENRVEALDVADLQHATALLGKLDQIGRLGGVVGHRFFDEHVPVSLEQ